MLRRMLTSSLVFALVLGSSHYAAAQAGKGTSIKVDGTIDQVLPNQGIVATGKDGKKYAIGFGPAAKVSLLGNASVDFLAAGTYVQMTVEMDGEGNPAKEVSKIQITEKGPLTPPGVLSTKGPDAKPGEPGPYLVRGAIKSIKNDEVTINAGAKPVTVKIAAGATIPVTLAAWQMAKPGDTISGDGNAISPPGASMTMVVAERIEIKAAMPITKPGKK